jgi:cell division protein FtsB
MPRRGPTEQPLGHRRGLAGRTLGHRHGLTGRALVLGAVLILLAVVLAPPLHRYLAARSALEQAEQQRRDDQRQLAELKRQLAQWDDAAYIQAQARSRLQYAMPGETVYIVVRPGQKTGLGGQPQRDTSAVQVPGGTWNERLWGSVLTADATP